MENIALFAQFEKMLDENPLDLILMRLSEALTAQANPSSPVSHTQAYMNFYKDLAQRVMRLSNKAARGWQE